MAQTVYTLQAQTYPPEAHDTWHRLYVRQSELVSAVACRDFLEGFPVLGLDPTQIPDPRAVSERLKGLTNWTLVDAQNKFLNHGEWFEHLAERRFPVTNYIRTPEEFDFSVYPDLFHEYFGHLSLFTRPDIADLSHYFGQLALRTRTEKQQLDLARIWWFIFEVGLIRQGDELKVIGGALLSSPGEIQHAYQPQVPKLPFSIDSVIETPGMYYTFHTQYFYVDSLEHIQAILDEYTQREGLS